jgi:N-acetylglucosamine-6-phosphate deacetylase
MLATTLASSDGELVGALDNLSEFLSERESSIVGAHLEGPWFNPEECGAQNPECIRAPREGELDELISKYPFIRRISAAPEIEGCLALGKQAKDSGIVASIAHTAADFNTVERAREYGYTLMTHLYSGMRGVVRKDSFRVGGAVEAGLYFDDLFVEIIADGCHLPSELLRYIYKIKGSDRVALITDAIRAAGMPDGAKTKIGSLKSGLDVIVEDGVAKLPSRQSFAGSAATADRL